MSRPATLKRFYDIAATAPAEDGFQVTLDGHAAKTPGGMPLVAPTRALARAVAAEWAAQDATIQPATMPLTGLLATTLERDGAGRAGVVEAIARYAETDLLCYRAAAPADLARRQAGTWQPILAWAAEALGVTLAVTEGVTPVEQPKDAVASLGAAVATTSGPELTALGAVVQASGSLVLGLALVKGHLDAESVAAAAELDESWQAERWGTDAESEARRRALRAEIAAAERFLVLVRAAD